MSLRASTSALPAACSGDMKLGVPITMPLDVSSSAAPVELRDAEVGEHRASRVFVEQNVRGLDVAMNDAMLVRIRERLGHLGENASRLFGVEPSFHAQVARRASRRGHIR